MTRIIRRKLFENCSPGLHRIGLFAISDKTINDKELYEFRFCVDELTSTGEPKMISCLASRILSARSKVGQIISALTGNVPDKEIDLDSLVGCECQGVIAHRQDADGRVWDQITSFLPLPNPERPPAPKFSLFDPSKTRQSFTLPPQN